jgi:uncharacterized membrane protein YsdA (DUF1294 family)/cold shock CspA family protein
MMPASLRRPHMRYQGKITSWKDDQGYGFIKPNGGGEQVFVHIKSFANTRRRPADNDLVTYELRTDEKRGPRAANAAFVGKRPAGAGRSGAGMGAPLFTALFFVLLLGAVVAGKLPSIALGLSIAASVVAFLLYARDKSAAQKKEWRTPESTLHLVALAGGWPGALLAQKVLRHKSSKQSFRIVFQATVLLNCGALLMVAFPAGSRLIFSFLVN